MASRQAAAMLCPEFSDQQRDSSGVVPCAPAVRVCVVGAGIAGLACALGAAQAGACVEVLEARHDLFDPPVHVNVVPSMLRALAALGIADEVVRRGFPYKVTDVVDGSGRPRFSLGGYRLAGERYPMMLGITHAQLLSVLRAALAAMGVPLRPGSSLELEASQYAQASAGANLVVVASRHEKHRQAWAFAHEQVAKETGQVWWRAVVPRPPRLDAAVLAMGHGSGKAGAIPVGMNQAGIYLLERDDGQPLPLRQQRVARMRRALSRYKGTLADMAASLSEASCVTVQKVRHACMNAPWHHGRFIAVGDAAHLLPPQFGQNGALAIEDALVLKELLQRLAADEVPAAFSQRRVARVHQIHDICVQAAKWDVRPQAHTDLKVLWDRLTLLASCAP